MKPSPPITIIILGLLIISLLNILLPDSQPNKKIYESFEKLINSINLENWIFLYIFFEINLIKDLGYDTNLGEHSNSINAEKDCLKIKIDGYIYEIPNYLIQKLMLNDLHCKKDAAPTTWKRRPSSPMQS